jgi:hypothetical protein
MFLSIIKGCAAATLAGHPPEQATPPNAETSKWPRSLDEYVPGATFVREGGNAPGPEGVDEPSRSAFQRTYILQPTALHEACEFIRGVWSIEGRMGYLFTGFGVAVVLPFAALLDSIKVISYPLRLAWNAGTGSASYDRY